MKIVVQKIPFVDAQTNDVCTRKNINNPFLKNMKKFHHQVQDTAHYELYTPFFTLVSPDSLGKQKTPEKSGV